MWSERTIGKAFRYVVEHVYLSTTCLHLLVLFYGLLQDRFNVSVKFTDIDYMVSGVVNFELAKCVSCVGSV